MRYPLARYRFEFSVTNSIRLPEYAGSTLRGAFGHALRSLACMTRAKTCDGCMLASSCAYTHLFEPQKPTTGTLVLSTPPVPYIIEPPAWGAKHYAPGQKIVFHFTLVGNAVAQLPLCIMAWRRAFARGIGPGDGTAEIIQVVHETQAQENTIYTMGEVVKQHPHLIELPAQTAPPSVTLQFITPLRLQDNGRALPPNKLTPRPLITGLVRRASLLAEHYHGITLYSPIQLTEISNAANHTQAEINMQWQDWTRRSARQQRTMQLGGCTGQMTLKGDLSPFWDAIRIGELLHVGKEASFGLGQYRIQ